ncbi:Alpha/Beta hydrolase fold [Trinorchestia longiramus]|nr:Alpha/Beta hydrolase fold [Trinorchestia longiramus]
MFKKQKTSSMDDDMYQPPPQFPDTLQGFGYHFKNGELCNIESGEKFQFVVKENDHHYNQLHYEALGKVIEEYVYELLETECGLHRLPVPADAYIRDFSSRKTTNQTDDAKAASSSVEGGMTSTVRGQEVSNRDVSSPLQNSTDQSDASASAVRVDNSDGNEDSSKISAESSSVGVGVLTENSREETVNESPDAQMEDTEACGELDPSVCKYTDRSGFVFASEGWNEQEKLMVLIHGSGVVRAGQWARRLIINDNLNTGTQIPFIKEAVSLGYGVIVMNTNQNFVVNKNGFSLSIPGSESPVAHACHVWQHYVIPSSASYVAVVAHSYGGVVVTHLFQEYMEHFRDKVFAVAFTDSVHNSRLPRSFTYFRKICRNWVTSMQPLDTPLPNRIPGDVRLLSAGVYTAVSVLLSAGVYTAVSAGVYTAVSVLLSAGVFTAGCLVTCF